MGFKSGSKRVTTSIRRILSKKDRENIDKTKITMPITDSNNVDEDRLVSFFSSKDLEEPYIASLCSKFRNVNNWTRSIETTELGAKGARSVAPGLAQALEGVRKAIGVMPKVKGVRSQTAQLLTFMLEIIGAITFASRDGLSDMTVLAPCIERLNNQCLVTIRILNSIQSKEHRQIAWSRPTVSAELEDIAQDMKFLHTEFNLKAHCTVSDLIERFRQAIDEDHAIEGKEHRETERHLEGIEGIIHKHECACQDRAKEIQEAIRSIGEGYRLEMKTLGEEIRLLRGHVLNHQENLLHIPAHPQDNDARVLAVFAIWYDYDGRSMAALIDHLDYLCARRNLGHWLFMEKAIKAGFLDKEGARDLERGCEAVYKLDCRLIDNLRRDLESNAVEHTPALTDDAPSTASRSTSSSDETRASQPSRRALVNAFEPIPEDQKL